MSRIMSFTEVWHMLQDVWSLYRKYAVRKLNEKELKDLTEEASKIHQKYKYPFTKDIVVAVVCELERSAKHFEEYEE